MLKTLMDIFSSSEMQLDEKLLLSYQTWITLEDCKFFLAKMFKCFLVC